MLVKYNGYEWRVTKEVNDTLWLERDKNDWHGGIVFTVANKGDVKYEE